MRLRRSDASCVGFTRRKSGKGWTYFDIEGGRITDAVTLERLNSLVLPPAWQEVWICPWPNGHLQALGTDAAGRRQYRYHDEWRVQRDAAKHERILDFGERLPAARERVAKDLTGEKLTRTRVLAGTFRLLDLGFFRVGGESYAEANNTYGLATMLREHVTVSGDVLTFEYDAKHMVHRVQSLVDDDVRRMVKTLLRRRDPNPELFAYRDSRGWHDVHSGDINQYLHEAIGTDASAKDFRTWHATVLMAVGLAVSTEVPESESARKRAVSRAVKEVAHYLGNTPTECRSSYIDPRIIDLYNDSLTIAPALERLGADADFGQPATHGTVEAAVRELLTNGRTADRRPGKSRRG